MPYTDINSLSFSGVAIADADFVATENGKHFVQAVIAVNRTWNNKDGSLSSSAVFLRIAFAGSEKQAKLITKGSRIAGVGTIRGSFTSKSGKNYIDVGNARQIVLISRPQKADEAAAAPESVTEEPEDNGPAPF